MAKPKQESTFLAQILNNINLRNEQSSQSRLLPELVKACWQTYGADQARVMLYTFGRDAGFNLCQSISKEYSIIQELNWNEFLESIETLGKIFIKSTVKIVSSTENVICLRVSDSSCCHKLSGFDEPCCDYLAGIFAAFAAYVFKDAETTCIETSCKATGYTPYCNFELRFNWGKK